MTSVSTHAYTRANAEVFLSDRMRNIMKDLVRTCGLNPTSIVDDWSNWVDNAVRTWLRSGHLREIRIEFFTVGADVVAARWDFPVRYDSTGIADMWVDDDFFEGSIAKAAKPPANCTYRVLLVTDPGRPDVPGVGTVSSKSLGSLTSRDAGTVIATPFMMAGARHYR